MAFKKQQDLMQRIKEFISNFEFEELLNILQFGIPVRRGTIIELRKNNFQNMRHPIFFLSTGRCGTKWFTKLLSKCEDTIVRHEPNPNFDIQGKKLYSLFKQYEWQLPINLNQAYKEMFLIGRKQFIRYSYKTKKIYIETNNQLTFFAPIINQIFPNTKFVHLIRHPGEFVRSAIRRGFYSKNADNFLDLKRIVPLSGYYKENWNKFDNIQKNSWLWFATNNFIENFKQIKKPKYIFTFNFNDMSINSITNLLKFLKLNIPQSKINKFLNTKINKQSKGRFDHYYQWSEGMKNDLKFICKNLSNKYGYNLH